MSWVVITLTVIFLIVATSYFNWGEKP